MFFLFFLLLTIYYFTSNGNTPYDYFTRLAASFLEGKYYLTEAPPWLNELVPLATGKYAVVFPPAPALLLIPLVAVFGQNFPQQYLAHFLGAGVGVLFFFLSLRIKKSLKLALWSTLAFSLGSIVWFLSATGSVWYLGQVTGTFFLTAAILKSTQKRPYATGVFLGLAYLSRVTAILALPFFVFSFLEKNKLKQSLPALIKMALGILPLLLLDFGYNYIRFGSIINEGYALIPGVLTEPWFAKGLIHPSYIPNHLKVIFTQLPLFQNTAPFIKPSWVGLAIWITSPFFVYSLWANIKEKANLWAWLVTSAIALLVFSHGSLGFTQFGHRYAVDFYPFLMLLTIKGVAKTGLRWHHWLLLILSILVNLWGVFWINKFGWVSY